LASVRLQVDGENAKLAFSGHRKSYGFCALGRTQPIRLSTVGNRTPRSWSPLFSRCRRSTAASLASAPQGALSPTPVRLRSRCTLLKGQKVPCRISSLQAESMEQCRPTDIGTSKRQVDYAGLRNDSLSGWLRPAARQPEPINYNFQTRGNSWHI
jgi:hypothetical protein